MGRSTSGQAVPVLMVGVGVRGRMWARVLADDPCVCVVGYVDPDPAARAWVRETFGPDARCFTGSGGACAAVAPALAVVATPPMERLPLCAALLDAGCDLLVEKPLALDLGAAAAIATHAERSGRRCFVAMNFRYAATSVAARTMLQRGDLGAPGLAHLTYWRNRDGGRRGLNTYPLAMCQPLLWEQSVHHLDLVRHIYAAEVASVVATTSNPPWSMYTGDATVSATLTLTTGMTVLYSGTWAARTARDRFHWRTDCEGGALIQTALFDGLHVVHDGTEAMEFVPLPFQEPFVDDMRALFRAVLHDLRTGDARAPAVHDHLRTLAVTAAIAESAETGRRVRLNDAESDVRRFVSQTRHSALSTCKSDRRERIVARTAKAIVVGGGVNGTSAAFHLAERGVKTVLLDRGAIAGASTGKSGGLVRMHYTDPYQARLAHESLPYFQDWRHRVGVGDPGFARTGFVQTVTPRNIPALHANVRMLQEIGVNTCIVSGGDVRRMQPWVDADDQTACAYEPDSGCAMPGETARSFAQAAQRLGAAIVTGAAVTGLRVAGGRVVGVATADGEYDAPLVIVCAGVWSVPLFAAIGVNLPVEPHRTQVVLFRRQGAVPQGVDGHMVFIDAALGSYFRPYGEAETLIGVRQRARYVASADEYNEAADPEIIADSKQALARRIPEMEGAAVTRHWAGILDMTPDRCPILEANLGADGLFLAAGFSGSGFKSGPYVGNLMATWAVTGMRPDAATPFPLNRFAHGTPITPAHPYVDDAGETVASVPH